MQEQAAQEYSWIVRGQSDVAPAQSPLREQRGRVVDLRPGEKQSAPVTPWVTAVIPARGGSRGVPRKNAKLLHGKPLVAYSIEAALNCGSINQVIVSSDDDEILSIAASYSPEIAWRRPVELSHDTANLADVVRHVSGSLAQRGVHPDVTVVLHPTSPFRNPRLMNLLVGKALAGHSQVVSARRMDCAWRGYYPAGDGLAPVDASVSGVPLYKPFGLFSSVSAAPLLPEYLHLIEDEIQLVDIDYPHQFHLAEEIVRGGHFDFDLR